MEGSWLRAGRVGSPHGLDGSFHVLDPRSQLLILDATVVVREQPLRIIRRAGTDQRPIVRLEGSDDRSAAEAMRGEELLVPRDLAPALDPDEWWAEDLEGCRVLADGTVVGTVTRMLALPSCEVLEVRRSGRGELLVPLIADAVHRVDIERREVEVDLGFLGEQ